MKLDLSDSEIQRNSKGLYVAVRSSLGAAQTANLVRLEKKKARFELWGNMTEMRQIGDVLKISRERVRQILRQITNETGITFPKNKSATFVDTRCKFCNVQISVYQFAFQGHGHHNCREHLYRKKYKTPEDAAKAKYNRNQWRYDNDPEYKRRRLAATMRYYHKTKHDPVRMAKHRTYTKNYNLRQKIIKS